MKFEFDEIITKANERKERLQVISELLDDCPAQYGNFLVVLDYINRLYAAFKALDDEGKAMLPKDIVRSLTLAPSAITAMARIKAEHSPNGRLGFSIVNATVQEHS